MLAHNHFHPRLVISCMQQRQSVGLLFLPYICLKIMIISILKMKNKIVKKHV